MPHVKYSIPQFSVLLLQMKATRFVAEIDVNDVLLTVYGEGSGSKLF